MAFKLQFPYSNSETEYEDLIIELMTVMYADSQAQGARRFQAHKQQVNGGFPLKQIALVAYQTTVQKLFKVSLFNANSSTQQTFRCSTSELNIDISDDVVDVRVINT